MTHPNLKRAWVEWIDERGLNGYDTFMSPVLVIETDINLAPERNTLDTSTLEDVIDAARAQFENRILKLKRVRIVPAGYYGN